LAPQPSSKEKPLVPQPVKIRFTKAKDGVISDSATGLEWYAGPDQDTSWYQAKAWTENLTVAGGGWRMPTVAELEAIYQKGAAPNNMDPIFQPTSYWVWSGQLRDASSAWGFLFYDGQVYWPDLDYAGIGRAFVVRKPKPKPQPLDLTRKDLQPLKEKLKELWRLRKLLAEAREAQGILDPEQAQKERALLKKKDLH
jgi:hypothetical protein